MEVLLVWEPSISSELVLMPMSRTMSDGWIWRLVYLVCSGRKEGRSTRGIIFARTHPKPVQFISNHQRRAFRPTRLLLPRLYPPLPTSLALQAHLRRLPCSLFGESFPQIRS